MNQNYSSRQRKIYHDYISFPVERLLEMIRNRKDFNSDVIDIIEDILTERNVPFPKGETLDYSYSSSSDTADYHNETFRESGDQDKVMSFVKKFREKEPADILTAITKYSDFEQEAVEAALLVAVDKGLISFDLKNSIKDQISSNTSRHWDRTGHYEWEQNNAFMGLIKGSTDDEIYNILEDPSGIVIDVYHAVLLTALNRELISQPDFAGYFENAKKAVRNEGEILDDEFRDFIRETPVEKLFDNLPDPEVEKEKYWKCPKCGESVPMEQTVCWNCETTIPENIVHPGTEEITKELIEESKPGIMPYLLIGIGFVLIIGAVILRGSIFGHSVSESLLIFLGIMVVVVLYNVIFKRKR